MGDKEKKEGMGSEGTDMKIRISQRIAREGQGRRMGETSRIRTRNASKEIQWVSFDIFFHY